MFWGWVVDFGLGVKDRELARGLDKDGHKLKAIAPKTRKHRRSAMTPDGKGDPSAPPLMPARALSRTRSLLAGRATPDAAVFYWRFDAFTGRSWGDLLAIQARKGRDVIGLSPKGIARVKALAWGRWRRWKKGEPIPAGPTPSASPGIPKVGSYGTKHATFGIGAAGPEAFAKGEWTGGMTGPEWRKYFTQPNPTPVVIPGRPAGRYPRILAHTWGQSGGGPPTPAPAPRPAPKPPPARKPGHPRPTPFDWSKHVDTGIAPFREQSAHLAAARESLWRGVARAAGIAPDEARARFAGGLKAIVDRADPYIRIKPETLGEVLRGGRFKNQFETKTSGGAVAPAERIRVEAAVIGVPEGTADAARPIYGYAGEGDFAGYDGPGEGWLAEYGSASVRLKPGAVSRATLTIGDSLSKQDQLQASRADAPSADALPVGWMDHSDIATRLVARPGDATANLRAIQDMDHYLELQFHGGVSVDDIRDVTFGEEPPGELAEALDERKIPWQVKPFGIASSPPIGSTW